MVWEIMWGGRSIVRSTQTMVRRDTAATSCLANAPVRVRRGLTLLSKPTVAGKVICNDPAQWYADTVMLGTHSTDTRSAYPWFGFEQTPQVHDGVDEPQIADEMTLGNLLDRYADRYAFACRKLDDVTDAKASSGEQRSVVDAS